MCGEMILWMCFLFFVMSELIFICFDWFTRSSTYTCFFPIILTLHITFNIVIVIIATMTTTTNTTFAIATSTVVIIIIVRLLADWLLNN